MILILSPHNNAGVEELPKNRHHDFIKGILEDESSNVSLSFHVFRNKDRVLEFQLNFRHDAGSRHKIAGQFGTYAVPTKTLCTLIVQKSGVKKDLAFNLLWRVIRRKRLGDPYLDLKEQLLDELIVKKAVAALAET